jgi:protein involved in polysaccharide export with SLBB domain
VKFLNIVLLSILMLMSTSVSAATPTKQQMEQFKSLPKAQQKSLAKKMGIDISAFTSKDSSSEQTELEPTIFPREAKEAFLSEEEKFKPVEDEIKPFGYELFAGDPTSFMPSEISAVPDTYTVGRGDEFKINLYGKENLTHTVIVDREGRLSIPDLTPVFVAGLSFVEVKELVKSKISQEVIGVKAFVSLGQLRSMRIMVLGESFKPGSYTVSSLTTVSHALFVSGGVSDIGSLRNIQVKRAGKVVQNFDLYDLLIKGDSSDDIMLKPGDVVFIPTVNKQVTISGLVKRPAIFELKNNETAQQLISMAGGFKAAANPKKTRVERFSGNNTKNIQSIDLSQSNVEFIPLNGDKITVPSSSNEYDNAITIMGAVTLPGHYQWQKGDSISSFITSLTKDILPIADFDYSLIVRELEIGGRIEVLNFSLKNIQNKDVKLKAKDVIIVFSRYESKIDEKRILNKLALTEEQIYQQLKSEQWQKFESEKFYDHIGQPIEEQEENDSDSLSQILKGANKKSIANQDYSVFSRYKLLTPVVLKLKEQANYSENKKVVYINGQIKYPGVYPFSVGAQVADLIVAAGGLLDSSYLEKSEVTRLDSTTKEIKHFEVNLKSELNNTHSLFSLQNEDTLHINKIPTWQGAQFVTIAGEVQFPGKYRIKKGESLSSLLKRSNGLTEFAFSEGAIFTRKAIRDNEKIQLKKLSNSLRREIASQSFQGSINTSTMSYDDTNSLLNDLSKVEALGRLVIDLDKIINNEADLQLQNGDVLYIPGKKSTVNILGEVNHSTSYLYDQTITVEQYLSKSGGLKSRADADSIYIIKANGSVVIPASNSWFAVETTKQLSPGDTIVVPLDTEHMDSLTLWSTATQILYQLGVAAAAIGSL